MSSKTQQRKSAQPAKKQPAAPKGAAAQEKTPAWWVFTKRSSVFTGCASALSEHLHKIYGEQVNIAHFERFIGEYPTLSEEVKELIQLDQVTLGLYDAYLEARRERDAERELFRSKRSVGTIESSLAKVREELEKKEPPDPMGPEQQ